MGLDNISLTLYIVFHFTDWERIFGEELYDHSFDPEENINLINRSSELNQIRDQLKRQMMKKFP